MCVWGGLVLQKFKYNSPSKLPLITSPNEPSQTE